MSVRLYLSVYIYAYTYRKRERETERERERENESFFFKTLYGVCQAVGYILMRSLHRDGLEADVAASG